MVLLVSHFMKLQVMSFLLVSEQNNIFEICLLTLKIYVYFTKPLFITQFKYVLKTVRISDSFLLIIVQILYSLGLLTNKMEEK